MLLVLWSRISPHDHDAGAYVEACLPSEPCVHVVRARSLQTPMMSIPFLLFPHGMPRNAIKTVNIRTCKRIVLSFRLCTCES
jgi:hypothetical protein